MNIENDLIHLKDYEDHNISCIYFIRLGTASEIKKSGYINNKLIPDNLIVYKLGETKSLISRMQTHYSNFIKNKINPLLSHIIEINGDIPRKNLETKIKHYFKTQMGLVVPFQNATEIFGIHDEDFPRIIKQINEFSDDIKITLEIKDIIEDIIGDKESSIETTKKNKDIKSTKKTKKNKKDNKDIKVTKKVHQCENCNKDFDRKSVYDYHILHNVCIKNAEQKTHICKNCGKGYVHQSSMSRHYVVCIKNKKIDTSDNDNNDDMNNTKNNTKNNTNNNINKVDSLFMNLIKTLYSENKELKNKIYTTSIISTINNN